MTPQEFAEASGVPANEFHPMVFVNGSPSIGRNVCIGFFSEVNAKGSTVTIGDNCDIASFVSINVADSHLRCIGMADEIRREPIVLGANVFVGSHSVILGGTELGHHSVVAAGSVVRGLSVPPYSLVIGNPSVVKVGHYLDS